MRWDQQHESPDVVDQRGAKSTAGMGGLGGLLFLLPMLLRSKFGWLILLLGGAYYAWTVFGGHGQAAPTTSAPAQGVTQQGTKAEQDLAHFVSFVLDDTQALWTQEFAARGKPYRHAKLVLFTNRTQTGCGTGGAATGPFYCPTDERAYIDLGFYRELEQKLGARGDFAQAYVIAHELGHHVQKLLGISEKVQALHGKTEGATGASVRLELQADCYAGIWAHSTAQRSLLEGGDIDEALGATAAIGDDRLQRQATGTVSPESWTHGSSDERSRWFRRGFDSGKMEVCDTFAANTL